METFNHLLLEYPEIMYTGVGATAFVAGGALIYKIATRKKPINANVNCWFCNQYTVVPYGNRNCWDCPNCDQYNGFQENGDYNKPIPAQYMEDLNHGVSGSLPSPVSPTTLQWVSSQMLLCKKCNKNQTAKIKQLASFIPRDDENYDEEIEAYKHHLEQTYKLCPPCQAAVEYYIKYQNRQLRTALLGHHLRQTRDTIKDFIKSSYSVSSPVGVILLRALAFLICAFLVATSFCGLADQHTFSSGVQILSGGVIPPKSQNESTPNNKSDESVNVWQGLLELLPDMAIENAKLVWQYGKENQMAVVSVGLLTCLSAIFLAGLARLRRIDAVASVLWFLILCLHLAESYVNDASSWMDTAKLSITSLCCLVSFAAAVATRKPQGLRRTRYRRYLPGSPVVPPYSSQSPSLYPDMADSIILTPPPNISKLINRQKGPRERTVSPSSLLARLSKALSLGTVPSFSMTDSGYLFSGSRPASPSSDYFSLKSVSRPSSPGPSPAPSVSGSPSASSSSSSARPRRPLISPARLNISSRKLRLFSTETDATLMSPPVSSRFHVPSRFHAPSSHIAQTPSVYSGYYSPSISPFEIQHDLSSILRERGGVSEKEKQSSSSESSACLVGTTTQGLESPPPPKGFDMRPLWSVILLASLSANLFFACLCLYNWM
ncbi:hypothetical protein PAMA_021864 [Pampus argenteus]